MFSKASLPEPLQSALESGIASVVKGYLDNGINLNLHDGKREHQGRPLLSFASMNGHTHVMELLIKRGAKVDKADSHGRTPLSWAAEYGQLNAVKLLIQHGAKPNTKDKEWDTPLSWVIHNGTGDKIDKVHDYLVAQGAKAELSYSFLGRCAYKVKVNVNMWKFKIKTRICPML
jgi:ankyrin repeat protein